jgi:hypothetical protein
MNEASGNRHSKPQNSNDRPILFSRTATLTAAWHFALPHGQDRAKMSPTPTQQRPALPKDAMEGGCTAITTSTMWLFVFANLRSSFASQKGTCRVCVEIPHNLSYVGSLRRNCTACKSRLMGRHQWKFNGLWILKGYPNNEKRCGLWS